MKILMPREKLQSVDRYSPQPLEQREGSERKKGHLDKPPAKQK